MICDFCVLLLLQFNPLASRCFTKRLETKKGRCHLKSAVFSMKSKPLQRFFQSESFEAQTREVCEFEFANTFEFVYELNSDRSNKQQSLSAGVTHQQTSERALLCFCIAFCYRFACPLKKSNYRSHFLRLGSAHPHVIKY